MFLVFCTLIAGFTIWRGIMPFKLSRKVTVALSVVAFLSAFNFVIRRLCGLEDAPAWVLLTFSGIFSIQAIYALLLIVYETIYWLVRGIYHLRKRDVPQILGRWYWRAGLLVPTVLVTAIGMYEALKMPEVSEYEIVLDELPPELDGMKIVHIADIHVDGITDGERVAAIVAQVNALEPDLVVLTGDMVDRRVNDINDDLLVLRDLRAKYGVYGVPGNHEYYSGYDKWIRYFNKNGVVMLENRHVMIADNNIVLGGTTDPAAKKMNMAEPDVAKTFAGAPAGKMRMLLAHQPKVAEQAAENDVALQLSGHTHGGMIYGLDLIVKVFNCGMISGEYDYRKTKVFVSNGTGIWSGFPVRLGHGSEIVLLRLRSGKR